MKTFQKSLIAASIAIASTVFAEGNHIAQVDEHGYIKKDYALTQDAGAVTALKRTVKPVISFEDETYSGQEAIDFLGDKLPEVASKLNTTPARLKHLFLNDSTLHVDQNGFPLYIDKASNQELSQSINNTSIPSTITFTGDVYKLHSKPGASKVIYLDFDGFDPTGTVWENRGISYFYGSCTIDCSNFIYSSWAMVSEDFSPYDVDVTTEEPSVDDLLRTSLEDEHYGVRAVITINTPTSQICEKCMGTAYINTFSDVILPPRTLNPFQPVLIFQSWPWAISHEIGHSLSLHHDGCDGKEYCNTLPVIMGNPVALGGESWSDGNYPTGNNHEDDLLIISQHIPYRTDTLSNSFDTAVSLEKDHIYMTSTVIKDVYGIIKSSIDKNVYSFATLGGNISLIVDPIQVSKSLIGAANIDKSLSVSNLYPKITLYDKSKNIIAIGTTSFNALISNRISLQTTVSAGEYYVVIESNGEYGHIGQYLLSGSYPANEIIMSPTSVISSSTMSGVGPLTVTYDSNNSTIGYGTSLNYTWIFDDGTPNENTPTVTRTYTTTGDYKVTLLVKNDVDLTAQSSVTIHVSAPLINTVKVKKLTLKPTSNKKMVSSNAVWTTVSTATATVVDEKNKGVAATTVCGYFNGNFKWGIEYNPDLSNQKYCGITNKAGVVTIKSNKISGKSLTMGFTISSVTNAKHSVYVRESSINNVIITQ